MSIQRSILHMDLDTFFVSCERLLDSRLNNRPILIGGTSDRGVVASCSYEARKFGINSGMPMRMAIQRCPEAVVIRGNSLTYSKFSNDVIEIIKESAPVYEISSIDEFYIDLTGMDKFFGCGKFSDELRTTIMKNTGLPISYGLSVNKTVSKVATGEAKPNNKLLIESGNEKLFLSPLSVTKIPMVGPQTARDLSDMGIQTIRTIQEMPMQLMYNALGRNGLTIWKKANGIDQSEVVPHQEQKSISTERTFEKDTIDIIKLQGLLIAMAENLALQLRRGNKLTSCVSVRIRFSDFQTTSMQRQMPLTSADHEIIPVAIELFNKLFDRRVLIRLISVKLDNLVNGHHQFNLFEDSTHYANLYTAMDRIRDQFGDRAIMRAAGMEAKTIGRSNPFTGQARLLLANRKQ